MTFSLWPPAVIFWTDDLLEHQGGTARRFVIKIRTKYAPGAAGSENPNGDQGLIQHELKHATQWWILLLTLGVVRLLHKNYRLHKEAQAFAVQTQFPDRHCNLLSIQEAAARLCHPTYGFRLTQSQAEDAIRGHL